MTSPVASLTEALIAANDALIGFLDIGEVSASSLDAEDVVPAVLERVANLVGAEALLMQVSDTTYSVGSQELRSSLLSALPDDQVGRERFRSTAIATTHASGLEGELRAGRHGEPFTTGDRKILAAGLRAALSAFETCRLHLEAVDAALAAREREHAAKIAQLALPITQPRVEGLDIHFENRQAHDTGGDLVCVHGDRSTFSFAVGDVAGKGLPAAVIMATAASAVNAALRDTSLESPGERLRQISDWIFDHLEAADLFSTMFIGEVDSIDGTVRWANAGHHPALIVGRRRHLDLAPTSPPLGVLRTIEAHTSSESLGLTDTLLVGSDGIVEQTDSAARMFGDTRLRRALVESPSSSIAARQLISDLASFAGDERQQDDQTMVIVRRAGVQ